MSIMPDRLKEGLPIWVKQTKTRPALPGIVKSWEPGGPTWVYVTVEIWADNPFCQGQRIKQTIRTKTYHISWREVVTQTPELPPRERISSLTVADQVHYRTWLYKYAALNSYPALGELVRAGQSAWDWAMQRNGMDWCFDCIEYIARELEKKA